MGTGKTKRKWFRLYGKRMLLGICLFLVCLGLGILLPMVFPRESELLDILLKSNSIAIVCIAGATVNIFLRIAYDIISRKDRFRMRPVKGFYQILQIIVWFIGAIIITGILINKSPGALLAGLGAFAAVLSFIFKDTLTGFISGIQLAANDMLRPGDWIVTGDGFANGTVIDITLITVKVQNFDNTVITVPAYSLITSPFQNWRGMQESGGRRITFSLNIDMNSIRFPDSPGLGTNLQRYMDHLLDHLEESPDIDSGMLHMIRCLEPSPHGLPLQVYCFAGTTEWLQYEAVKGRLMQYAVAKAGEFHLKIFNWANIAK